MDLGKYIECEHDGLNDVTQDVKDAQEESFVHNKKGSILEIGAHKFRVDINKMDEDMTIFAFEATRYAFIRFRADCDRAKYVSEAFDKSYGKYWDCILGQFFGSRVYHRTGRYITFYIDKMRVLIFENLRN